MSKQMILQRGFKPTIGGHSLGQFFPNRGLRPIRVLITVQRGGYTETHTKRDRAAHSVTPAAASAVSFSFDVYSKSHFLSHDLNERTNCNGKNKGFALQSLKKNKTVLVFIFHLELFSLHFPFGVF